MNKATLNGRLTKDIELRYTQDQKAIGRFTLAVRRRKKDDGADFVSCTAFGKDAEILGKYTKKGDPLCISGRIHTGSYTNKDGAKVYTTEIYVDDFDLPPQGSRETSEEDVTVPANDPYLPF